MTKKLSHNESLIQAFVCNRQAIELFEYALPGLAMSEKSFVKRLISRCTANQNDAVLGIQDEKNKKVFIENISKGDILQLAYIVQWIFEMDPPTRDAVEKMIGLIHSGKKIEIAEPV